ncbi:MAG: hypothetical protein ACI4VQ_00525 [Clostridia bacterium]
MNKLLEKIESDKEILTTMPKNNKKNIAKYIANVEELKNEYQETKQQIYEEMNKRYEKIISVKENAEINMEESELEELETFLDIIETTKTSYEKMGIDKRIYKLGKFYKENLENINTEILSCINKFSEVGINLTESDFDYSLYVYEYMTTFFEEKNKENVNSDIVKSKFEEIYWKCPDIIIHIELNLRYIYLKNQKSIDKYYDRKITEIFKNINVTPDKIQEKYSDLKKKLDEDIRTDKYLITQSFLDGKLSTKDYEQETIKGEYIKLTSDKFIKNISKKDLKELNQNSIKFLHNLEEYKNYLKFQYIFDDIKKKYQEREQYKNSYNTTKKEIVAKEKKLKSLNKKITGKSLFGKKDKLEKQTAEYNSMVLELKELYKQMDNDKIYSKIIEELSESSTIYDALKFASQFNNYLVDCIIENNKTITQKEIDEVIYDLQKFLNNPYNIIIKNITILEDKNIPIIISDRYKLLNFSINKEDINEGNIDNLITTLQKIQNSCNIQKSGLKLEDMQFICEFKKIKDSKK